MKLVTRFFVFVSVLVVVSACSGGSSAESSTSTVPESAISEAEDVVSTSTTTTTSVTEEESRTSSAAAAAAESAGSSDSDVEALWAELWQLAAQPGSTEADFAALASAEVASELMELVGGDARSITNYPATSPEADNGVVAVHDCLIADPPLNNPTLTSPLTAQWLSGEVARSDSGELQITSVNLEPSFGCVPEEVSDAAIADYLSARAGQAAYWVSQDIELLSEGTTGNRFEFIVDLVASDQEEGIEVRGFEDFEHHPFVNMFTSPTDILIIDCHVPATTFGLFDIETGERLDGIPPIDDNTRIAGAAEMVFTEGRWKIFDSSGPFAGCDLESRNATAPVIGVGGERIEDQS